MSRSAMPALTSDAGFRNYLLEVHKFPMLGADEEYMLAKRWSEHGDYDAAHKLVTSHLRLVAKIASGFKGYGLPMTDMVAEGNIGLMQAVKKFDPERGFRLSTYAMWWIRASIQEYILRSWSLVKVGSSATQKRLFFNLKRLKNRLLSVDESEQLTPDQISEIASELEVNEGDVMAMDARMSASDRQLDAPAGGASAEEGANRWIDLLPSPDASEEEVLADKQDYQLKSELLKSAMATLNEREQDIIQQRRLADPAITLEELSQKHGVSRERIRQIENRAMEKITAEIAKHAAA